MTGMCGPGSLGALASISLAAASAALAQDAAPAQEAPRWQLAASADRCMIARTYSGAQPASLSLQTRAGSDTHRLTVAAPALPPLSREPSFPVTVALDTGQRFEARAQAGAVRDVGKALLIALQPDFTAAMAGAKSLTVTLTSGTAGPFPLPDAAAAVAAYDGCTAERLVAMGADPAQFRPGGKRPVPIVSRDEWIGRDQFMAIAREAGGKGLQAEFRVAIAADGRIESCARTGDPAGLRPAAAEKVEQIACGAVTGRPLFQPARASDGTAVRGAATFDVELVVRRDYEPVRR